MRKTQAITDPKRRARICACYAATGSTRETGRSYGISSETVRGIVRTDRPELLRPAKGGAQRKAGGR